MTAVVVDALLTGLIRRFDDGMRSAIDKRPREGRVAIGRLGLDGDQQQNKRYHGGPEMAVHHYPTDHYATWRAERPDHPLLDAPGAFGENVATHGLTEAMVSIGDRFRLGTALLEIGQGRVPCSKLARRMDWKLLPKRVTQLRACGWYYRVIEEGAAEAGDVLTLTDRAAPEWTVERVFALLIANEGRRDPAACAALADLAVLAPEWREKAQALLDLGSRAGQSS